MNNNVDFGTKATEYAFYDAISRYRQDSSRLNKHRLKVVYQYLISSIRGEYKRGTITKDELDTLYTDFSNQYNESIQNKIK